MKFGKVKLVFVPSLNPDNFAGFPGFFLSAREALTQEIGQPPMRMILVGPQNTKQTMERSTSFTGDYYNQLEVLEIPDDLTSPPMHVDEESKS